MKKQNINYQNTLFFITILFFIIGIVHISFAIIGLACFIIPFILFGIYKEKIWCKFYCPRAGLFSRIIGKISLKKKIPKFITSKRMKNGVLIYFGINMFFVLMSTLMVALGKIAPLNEIRFLIAFTLPINLPQLLTISPPSVLMHLGYRVYSIMLTSTTIGIVLGIIFAPRTWCIICPIQSLTTPQKKPSNL